MDFDNTPVDIVFTPDTTEVMVPVTFTDDDINEADEGLILRLEILEISAADMSQLEESLRDTAVLQIVVHKSVNFREHSCDF